VGTNGFTQRDALHRLPPSPLAPALLWAGQGCTRIIGSGNQFSSLEASSRRLRCQPSLPNVYGRRFRSACGSRNRQPPREAVARRPTTSRSLTISPPCPARLLCGVVRHRYGTVRPMVLTGRRLVRRADRTLILRPHNCLKFGGSWCRRGGSNSGPTDREGSPSAARPFAVIAAFLVNI